MQHDTHTKLPLILVQWSQCVKKEPMTSVGIPGLLMNPFFNGNLHFLVTCEPMIYQWFVLGAEDIKSQLRRYWSCTEDVWGLPIKVLSVSRVSYWPQCGLEVYWSSTIFPRASFCACLMSCLNFNKCFDTLKKLDFALI